MDESDSTGLTEDGLTGSGSTDHSTAVEELLAQASDKITDPGYTSEDEAEDEAWDIENVILHGGNHLPVSVGPRAGSTLFGVGDDIEQEVVNALPQPLQEVGGWVDEVTEPAGPIETKPIGYATLVKDLLAGTSARQLRRRNEFGNYTAAANVIDFIGARPNNPNHLRGNHSLEDRLTNVSAVFNMLCDDYGIMLETDYATSREDSEQALTELTNLESELKLFDVSDARLRRVKSAGFVKDKRNLMLDQIATAKQTISEMYGIDLPERDPLRELLDDIVVGKSARYLQSTHGVDISRNHSWRERVRNLSEVLYGQFNFDPLGDEDLLVPESPKTYVEDRRMRSVIATFKGALSGIDPQKRTRHLRGITGYLALNFDLQTTEDTLDQYQKEHEEETRVALERLKVSGRDSLPIRYLSNDGPEDIVAFDLRRTDSLEAYRHFAPEDSSAAAYSARPGEEMTLTAALREGGPAADWLNEVLAQGAQSTAVAQTQAPPPPTLPAPVPYAGLPVRTGAIPPPPTIPQ